LRGWSVYIALDDDKIAFWKAAGSTLTRIGVVHRVEVKSGSLEQVGIAGSTRTAVRLTLKAEVDGSPSTVDLVANGGQAIVRLSFVAEFDQIIAAWLSPS
jgi:hypothetical protein